MIRVSIAKESVMSHTKSVGQGFFASASIICLFLTMVWLPKYVDLWVALALFTVLAVPFALNCLRTVDRFAQHNNDPQVTVKKAKTALMGLQGLGFACWFFDVLSTIFLIDIQQTATELNFLGWPFSALGALVFYVPMVFVVYFLLYRVKSKMSFYVTVVVSVLVLFMGALNFNAALYNFNQVYPYFVFEDFLVMGIWVAVVLVLAGLNVAAVKAKGYA